MRMKNPRNAKRILAVLAFAMVLGLSVKGSLAYFTTYVTAQGTQQLTLGWQTELEEKYEPGRKTIHVKNIGQLECYVRVRVFAGDERVVQLSYSGSSKWTKDGDYWYYSDIVPAGGSTEDLIVEIDPVKEGTSHADYDVIVIQECAQVLYEDGKPLPPTDETVWSQKFEVKQ